MALIRLLLLILMFFASSLASTAQSKYIIAGQQDSMICTQFVPPLLLCVSECDPFTSFGEFPIDLNHDGKNDLTILVNYYDCCGGGGLYYSGSLEIALNSGCSISSTLPFQGDLVCFPGTHTIAKTYFSGDTLGLNPGSVWRDSTNGIDTCIAVNVNASNDCFLSDSNNTVSSPFYCGFNLIQSGDTLLGYFHLSNINVAWENGQLSFYMLDFAVQGHMALDTITAVNSVNITPSIEVFPTPFNDVLHIKGSQGYTYSVSTMNGILVKKGIGADIDTRSLTAGVYILELQNETELIQRKIVKAN